MKIIKLTSRQVTNGTRVHLENLMYQLREEKSRTTLVELKRIVGNPTVTMAVAKDGSRIVGVATLYTIQKVGKHIAHIEDVVVDSAYRGRGLGKKLIRTLIAEARKRKIKTLNLTSRPARIVANKLYKKLGFKLKKTNVYQFKL